MEKTENKKKLNEKKSPNWNNHGKSVVQTSPNEKNVKSGECNC